MGISENYWFCYDIGYDYEPLTNLCDVVYATMGFVALLFKNLVLNDLDVSLLRLVQRPRFIDVSAVASDPLSFVLPYSDFWLITNTIHWG